MHVRSVTDRQVGAMAALALAVLLGACDAARPSRDMMTVDRSFAEHFAEEWVESWNSHDLERVLSHYTDDFEMTSPNIIRSMGEPSGRLVGKDAMREYWGPALGPASGLHFEILETLVAVNSVVIYYQTASGRTVGEIFYFNADGKVYRAAAHYSA